jgi:hypothetical protein
MSPTKHLPISEVPVGAEFRIIEPIGDEIREVLYLRLPEEGALRVRRTSTGVAFGTEGPLAYPHNVAVARLSCRQGNADNPDRYLRTGHWISEIDGRIPVALENAI